MSTLAERIAAAEAAMAAGDIESGRAAAAALVAEVPGHAAVHRLAARAALAVGDPRAAKAALERATVLAPADADAWWQLANLCLNLREEAGAIGACQRVLAIAPSARGAHYLAALAHMRLHDPVAARRHCDAALRLDPAHWPTRMLAAALPPGRVTPDEASAAAWIAGFDRVVADLARTDLAAPGARQQLYEALTTANDFHAAYFTDTDASALRRRHGTALARVVAAVNGPMPAIRAIAAPGRRRVLVIGAHLHAHSVTRVTAGLLAGLSTGGHEVHVLHLSRREDAVTRRIAAGATSYRAGSFAPGAVIAYALAVDADVVVYPELGQDPATMWCAATRLAPVQMALWGHPLTSGLSTIDHFVTPGAMERTDADADYTEVLYRLPGLGGDFDPPDAAPDPQWRLPMRERHPDAVQLLVAQHALKVTPAHDACYARILAAAPKAVLTILVHPVGQVELAARLRPSLAAAGVDPSRVEVRAPLAPAQFAAAARQCDLNLDTIGWSGGVSTLDLTHHGLPTLTCPQRALRSRQSMAMMQVLGLDELVAHDTDDWTARAIALARAPDRLAALRREVLARRGRLFGERDAVGAFAELVARATPR